MSPYLHIWQKIGKKSEKKSECQFIISGTSMDIFHRISVLGIYYRTFITSPSLQSWIPRPEPFLKTPQRVFLLFAKSNLPFDAWGWRCWVVCHCHILGRVANCVSLRCSSQSGFNYLNNNIEIGHPDWTSSLQQSDQRKEIWAKYGHRFGDRHSVKK